jgi:hypothetical protein
MNRDDFVKSGRPGGVVAWHPSKVSPNIKFVRLKHEINIKIMIQLCTCTVSVYLMKTVAPIELNWMSFSPRLIK